MLLWLCSTSFSMYCATQGRTGLDQVVTFARGEVSTPALFHFLL